MILPYINVPQSLISSDTALKVYSMGQKRTMDLVFQREQNGFLKIVRQELKANLFSERGKLVIHRDQAIFAPICPICLRHCNEGSMHEVILDRGDIAGVPFEVFIQSMVPWNTVIVHEPKCHLIAQHEEIGRDLCVDQILKFYTIEKINEWLDWFADYLPASSINKARDYMAHIQVKLESGKVIAHITSNNRQQFNIALQEIQSIPEEDRFYDGGTKNWTIVHPEKYKGVDFIKRAYQTDEMQMRLFNQE